MNTPKTPWKPVTTAAAWLAIAAILVGCGHGDAIIFASNKQIGIKVGVDSQKIPEVSIGYNGQDFALVPVHKKAAKAGETSNSGSKSSGSEGNADGGKVRKLSELGKYLATSGINDKDAYSVYGSFVGKAQGGVKATNTAAKMELSQFFATGIAAQLLAKNAGAAMVNPKAKAPAEASAETARALAAYLPQHEKRTAALLSYVTQTDGSLDKERLKTLAKGTSIESDVTRRLPQLDAKSLSALLKADWQFNVDDLYNNLPEALKGKP